MFKVINISINKTPFLLQSSVNLFNPILGNVLVSLPPVKLKTEFDSCTCSFSSCCEIEKSKKKDMSNKIKDQKRKIVSFLKLLDFSEKDFAHLLKKF